MMLSDMDPCTPELLSPSERSSSHRESSWGAWLQKLMSPSSSLLVCWASDSSHDLQHRTRRPAAPQTAPSIRSVHAEQKICPHTRQWCFLLNVVNARLQWKQLVALSSFIQNSLESRPGAARERVREYCDARYARDAEVEFTLNTESASARLCAEALLCVSMEVLRGRLVTLGVSSGAAVGRCGTACSEEMLTVAEDGAWVLNSGLLFVFGRGGDLCTTCGDNDASWGPDRELWLGMRP